MAKRITVAIPFHWMENWEFFLTRCLKSIEAQTFTDYEVILINHSTMPVTSNRTIESSMGELIKILYMDDYLAHGNALQEISDNFTGEWLVTGCLHDNGQELGNYHSPKWTDDLYTGNNCIGSPSVLTMKREGAILFDARLSWLLDCDLYQRLYDSYGPPTLLDTPNVAIGLHKAQTTYLLSDSQKQDEHRILLEQRP